MKNFLNEMEKKTKNGKKSINIFKKPKKIKKKNQTDEANNTNSSKLENLSRGNKENTN